MTNVFSARKSPWERQLELENIKAEIEDLEQNRLEWERRAIKAEDGRDRWQQIAIRERARFRAAKALVELELGHVSDSDYDAQTRSEGYDKVAAKELNAEAKRLIVAEDGDLQRLEYVTYQMLGHQIVPPDVLEMLERWKKQLGDSK